MTKKQSIVVACALLIVGGLYYWLSGHSAQPPAGQQTDQSQMAANVSFAGSSIVEEKDGKKLWELKAESIEADPDGKIANLTNLTGVFYQDKGGTVNIVAEHGRVDLKSHDILLTGAVKAVTSDGAVFTANEAKWVGEPKTFQGSGGVSLVRDGTTITGDTIQTDTRMEKFRVSGHAKVVTGGKN